MKKLILLFLQFTFLFSAGHGAFAARNQSTEEELDALINFEWGALDRYRSSNDSETLKRFNQHSDRLFSLYQQKGINLTEEEFIALNQQDPEKHKFVKEQVLAEQAKLNTPQGLLAEIERLIRLSDKYKSDKLRGALIRMRLVSLSWQKEQLDKSNLQNENQQ